MKLIDKDAVVAEIERIVDVLERNSGYGIFCESQMVICEKILSFLDTLEVKDTDALINKGCNFIRERLRFDDDAWYIDGEVTLKDKVIEEFKKYMKGE